MSLREDLIAAKALISSPRMWRKDGSTLRTSCCAVIAANRVMAKRGDWRGRRQLWRALYDALPEGWQTNEGDDYGPIVGDYNDDPATTHADIMALFDRAIEAATPHSGEKQ